LFLISNFSSSSSNDSFSQINNKLVSQHHVLIDASSQQISEETETETESCFEMQELILPFVFSFFQISIFQAKQIFVQPLSEKLTNPIYISVCNFRI
jgi:hypothetical protein